jgi:hypothetical protein
VAIFDPIDGTVSGNRLYVYGDFDGVTIVDITNLASPVVAGHVATAGGALGVAVYGPNLIAVTDTAAGVTFIDVSNPAAPVVKATQRIPGVAEDLLVIGKTIYVASWMYLDALKLP